MTKKTAGVWEGGFGLEVTGWSVYLIWCVYERKVKDEVWVEPGVGGRSKDGLWIFWEEKIHWWCGKNREIEYSDGSDGWKGCSS